MQINTKIESHASWLKVNCRWKLQVFGGQMILTHFLGKWKITFKENKKTNQTYD